MPTRRGAGIKLKDPRTTMKRLLSYVGKKYKLHLVFVVICIFTNVFATLQGTMFMQQLIDDYIMPMIRSGSGDFGPLTAAIIRVAGFYALGILASFLQGLTMATVSQGTMLSFRTDLFSHMQNLPIRYFDTHKHGDIMSLYTNDTDALRQMISQSIPQMISSVVTIVGVISLMIYYSPVLFLVTLLMIFVMLFSTVALGKNSGKYFVKQQSDIGAVNANIEEIMNGQKVVKVFCHEEKALEDFNKLNEELFVSADNANKYANMMGPANAQIGNISFVLVSVVGAIMSLNGFGGFTIGRLVSYVNLNRSLNMPIMQVSQQANFIIMALAGAERIFALMDEEPETDEGYVMLVNAKEVNGEIIESEERTGHWAWKHYHKAEGTTTYQPLQGKVVFDDVDFEYEEGKPVLHNITMFAEPGQKIAFVGATGAGKTTITNLINRFYDIADGKIRYDDININKIKKADLRRSLGIVLQDTHLFTGTVADNIRYGKLGATEEEVIAAAKLANAHGFIKRLPNGYDTVISSDGGNLSQGQRQLLAIARAAIADPPVLILDEATSSIDTRTEKIVQDGMDKLMSGRTTFVIAHRLSTIKNSDCIMVLDSGRIIERGNHDELIAEGGKYYQLYTGKIVNA